MERLRHGESWASRWSMKTSQKSRGRNCWVISSAKIWPNLWTATMCLMPRRARGRAGGRKGGGRELTCHSGGAGSWLRRSARWRSCLSLRCSSCMASTMRCRCSWRRLQVSLSRCWELSIFPKCAPWPCVRRSTNIAEYYFLFPLFFSITLLTKAGFFDSLQSLIQLGIETLGHGHVAFAQFLGCTFLSAILDNNVVADFASRALHGLDISILHLFAMAQIAGYALGGCWTHIGSRAIGGRFRVYSARYGRPLHAGAVDQGDDASDSRNDGGDNGHSLYRKRAAGLAKLGSYGKFKLEIPP